MRLIENNFDNVRLSLSNAQILDTEVTWRRFCETVNGLIVGNRAKMASAEDKRLGVYFVHEKDLTFDSRALPTGDAPTLLVEYNSLLGAERLGTITDEQKTRLKEIRDALIHNRQFPEKVIKYLWDDAFKFNPEVLFDTGEGITQSVIISSLSLSKQTVNSSIAKMQKEGLLYLSEKTGRQRQIYLTEAGKRIIREKIVPLVRLEESIFQSWTKEEREAFLRLNGRFRDELRKGIQTL